MEGMENKKDKKNKKEKKEKSEKKDKVFNTLLEPTDQLRLEDERAALKEEEKEEKK
jgi:hypothetical protein